MAKPLLPDELWAIIEPILPKWTPSPKGGQPRLDDRKALAGILFVLKTGIPWEDLPREMGGGCGMTCWRRLRDWQANGTWEKIHKLGMHNYESSNGALPPSHVAGVINGTCTNNGFSAQARILSFMEQGVAFNSINFSCTHRTVQNATVVGMALTSLLCPSDPNLGGLTPFPSGVNARVPCYGVNEGDWHIWSGVDTSENNIAPKTRGVFAPNICRRIDEFTDGTSQTLLATDVKALQPFCNLNAQFSEANHSSPTAVPPRRSRPRCRSPRNTPRAPATPSPPAQAHTAWVDGIPQETGMTTAFPPNKVARNPTANTDLDILTVLISKNLPMYGALSARSYHSGGVNSLLADGSVRFVKSTIDGNTWRALGTIQGNEVLSADAY